MNQKFLKYLNRPEVKQSKLANDLGVRQATISDWKAGTIPRSPMLPRIAEATGGAVPVESWFSQEATA